MFEAHLLSTRLLLVAPQILGLLKREMLGELGSFTHDGSFVVNDVDCSDQDGGDAEEDCRGVLRRRKRVSMVNCCAMRRRKRAYLRLHVGVERCSRKTVGDKEVSNATRRCGAKDDSRQDTGHHVASPSVTAGSTGRVRTVGLERRKKVSTL